MSDSPWIDIPPKPTVKEALLGKSNRQSTGTKYAALVQAVQQYHSIPKDEVSQFLTRSMMLRNVADAAVRAMGEAKSQGHQKYLSLLGQRALAKAMYLDATHAYLQQNPDQINDIHGFLERMTAYRAPMPPQPPSTPKPGWQKVQVGGGTFSMIGSVAFEAMDPYHREFEVHLNNGANPWHGARGGGVGSYMIKWANRILKEGYNKPFLAYLEDSHLCHFSVYGEGMTAMVGYSTGGQLLEGTALVTVARGARLHETTPTGQDVLFDTNNITVGKGREHRAKAYVWTAQGDFIVGVHAAGKLHHSSFVGGDVVRCAGMIGATAGRVHYIDNNSGHYRPDSAHIHGLIKYLSNNDLFTSEAYTEVNDENVQIVDYLFKPTRSFFGEAPVLGGHRGR
jgi:hypothetical protein